MLPPIAYEADTTHQLGLLYEVRKQDGVGPREVRNTDRFDNCFRFCVNYTLHSLMLVDASELGKDGSLEVLWDKFCDQLNWTLKIKATPGEHMPQL